MVLVLTWTVGCGSPPSAPVTTPPIPTPPLASALDAALVEPPPAPKLACGAGAVLAVAPAPEPTWFCARADGVRDGAAITQFPDGAIALACSYRDGLLDGAWERRHPNGAIAEVGTYVAGKKHGVWKQHAPDGKLLGQYELVHGTGIERYWYDDGALYAQVAVKDGALHGAAKLTARDGTLVTSSWYERGKLHGRHVVGTPRSLRFEENYTHGVLTGKREIWTGQVPLAEERFDRRGLHDGEYRLWRSRRVMRALGRYLHGKRIGAWLWRDRDGNTERTGRYVRGQRDGVWTEYANGKVVFTGNYVAGKPHGTFVWADRNGNELGRFTMTNGTGTWLTFWGNKKVASKRHMTNGVDDGPYQELTMRGKVVVDGRYRGGVKHGTWQELTPDGVLVREQTWKRGKLDGTVKKYVDGQPSLVATYLDGQAHGPYAELRDGKPAVTGAYAADRKTGTWTHYARDNTVVLVATYVDGVLAGPWRQLTAGSVLEGTMVAGRRSGSWTLTDTAGRVRKLDYGTP